MMANTHITDKNILNLCRLCLQADDFLINVFDRLDPNSEKLPLPERIFQLFQVKVERSKNFPTHICHTCLYMTEMFWEFKRNVEKCDRRLHVYIKSNSKNFGSTDGLNAENISENSETINKLYSDENRYENVNVTIVDPNKEYVSSDESFDLDSDDDYNTNSQVNMDVDKEEIDNANDTNTENLRDNIHINSENPDMSENIKNVFLCQYCDMAFISQIECNEHEARHDVANPYSCNYCPFRCAERQIIVSHIKMLHNNERPFVCVQCNKCFGRRSDLKKHTIVHTGIRPFSCPVCGKHFSRNTNLTKHLRIHSGLKPHVCQMCPRSFTTSADLIRHQRVHNNVKPFKCSICFSAFNRKDKLLHHERTHGAKVPDRQFLDKPTPAPNTRTNIGAENMVISLNPFTDIDQAEHVDNNLEIHKIIPFNSKSPDKLQQILSNSSLLSPIQHVTGDTNIGSRNIKTENNLSSTFQKQNISSVSAFCNGDVKEGKRNHICSICSKAFMRKRELQRHLVIHTGVKPFACKICNKRFNRKDKVIRHERIHVEDKKEQKQKIVREQLTDGGNSHLNSLKNERHIENKSNNFEMGFENFRPKLNFYSELKDLVD